MILADTDRIMSRIPPNRVRELRKRQRWAQIELAKKTQLSRTAISAIEGRRLVPSVAAALSLARVFQTSVEDLFGSPPPEPKPTEPEWAWVVSDDARWWAADVDGRPLLFPVEDSPTAFFPHDGHGPAATANLPDLARRTLVIATCDPAVGLVAKLLWEESGIRLLAFSRSSRAALTLLKEQRIHAAGVHLAGAGRRDGNRRAAKEILDGECLLLPVGQWQSGLSLGPGVTSKSVKSILSSRLTWIGREEGSGAYDCQQAILGDRSPPRRIARDHRGVIEAIRSGWADVGVSLRWITEDAGLRFVNVREELYELCLRPEFEADPRWLSLVRVLRSPACRQMLAALPGFKVEAKRA